MKQALDQGARFLASGGLAFTTDAAILIALTKGAGLDPYTARALAIGCAMIVGFFAHRRITFVVGTPPTWPEFAKFLSVAISASALNYAIYAGLLYVQPATEPIIALIFATAISMCFSFIGYRFGVFRKPPN